MENEIEVQELKALLDAGEKVLLVDVRQDWEHELARLPDSVLLPLHELPERLDELEVPEGGRVVVYCHHGIRSLTGAAILEHAGIRGALSLAGGIDAWSARIDPSVPRY